MNNTIRPTVSQALVRYLAALRVEFTHVDGRTEVVPYVGGAFAIFGHGNVAALGEALYEQRAVLPTWRAHNEQGMALAATAYAKAHMRRRILAVSSSIGMRLTWATAAAVTMLVAPGPIELLTARMRWRKWALA